MLDDLGVRAEYDHLGGHYTRPKAFSGINTAAIARHEAVVGLIRDPLDTVVSGYFQCRFRNENFTASLSEFVASPQHGIERIARYNLGLVDAVCGSPRAMVVRYEELHINAAATLEAIAHLVGFPVVKRRRLRPTARLSG